MLSIVLSIIAGAICGMNSKTWWGIVAVPLAIVAGALGAFGY